MPDLPMEILTFTKAFKLTRSTVPSEMICLLQASEGVGYAELCTLHCNFCLLSAIAHSLSYFKSAYIEEVSCA